MKRIAACLALLVSLVACAGIQDQPPKDLGEFRLGHNVVIASKMQKGPVSRDATEEEWVSVLKTAVDQRFGGFEGDQLYHLGISVEGYMLAPPGVPVLYNPRSALILRVTAWDDTAGVKLNETPEMFQVLEDTTKTSAISGSGNERTKEEQMEGLAANAMDQIGEWLEEQHKENGWFDRKPETEAAETTESG